MKQFITLILFTNLAINCIAQSKTDKVLQKKISNVDQADIDLLIQKRYISKIEAPMLGAYMIQSERKNKKSDNQTLGQLLRGYNIQKKQTNSHIAKKYHYGADSVYIRMPDGLRLFMGLGKLSLEKLVARETSCLPKHYEGEFDLKVNSVERVKMLAEMIARSDQSWLTGNIMLIKREDGSLKNMRLGDFFLISRKVATSPEFAPFVEEMSSKLFGH